MHAAAGRAALAGLPVVPETHVGTHLGSGREETDRLNDGMKVTVKEEYGADASQAGKYLLRDPGAPPDLE